jgi:hypothetical protein
MIYLKRLKGGSIISTFKRILNDFKKSTTRFGFVKTCIVYLEIIITHLLQLKNENPVMTRVYRGIKIPWHYRLNV